ncbi:MAG TPA: hypothetical protein VGD59_10095 [Acidisarcina sp.]
MAIEKKSLVGKSTKAPKTTTKTKSAAGKVSGGDMKTTMRTLKQVKLQSTKKMQ